MVLFKVISLLRSNTWAIILLLDLFGAELVRERVQFSPSGRNLHLLGERVNFLVESEEE